ncbi:class I SAM-dependent methyltransferase [Alkaliflexus imshenetskii]|uniref:class I SAM-dependent methyltransferase n=1 Tax=Alkaliflexus imshenetskii TaxID=286730 RepID=UPI00047EB68D|nr:methyltransferase domain-containing protein [Alkaliflexus imshenetskii]
MAFYESIAPWYDFIFPVSPVQGEFIKNQTDGVNGKHLLDVGCGTGNLALSLASQGAIVTGIDLDKQMLEMGAHKATDYSGVSFQQVNMLEVAKCFAPHSFDGVACFGNTLVHLQKPGQILSFFNQCAGVLKPWGSLLLQVINYDYVLDSGLERLPLIENEQIRFERFYELREQDELINFRTVLTVKETGGEIRNSVPLLPIRRDLLRVLLDEAGFGEIHFFGGFDGSRLTTQSLPLVVSARLD